VDSDAKLYTALGRQPGIALDHAVLNLDSAAHGVDYAADFDQRSVAPVRFTTRPYGIEARLKDTISDPRKSRPRSATKLVYGPKASTPIRW
jgi:hypothetical protein